MTGCMEDVKKAQLSQQKVSCTASIISAPAYDNSSIKFKIEKNINGVLMAVKHERLNVWVYRGTALRETEHFETDHNGVLTVNLKKYLTADYRPINFDIFWGEIKIVDAFFVYPRRFAKELIEIRVEKLWAFSEPNAHSQKIKEVVQRDRYEILEKRSSWVKIKITNNGEGWIPTSCGKSDCGQTKVELKW